MSIPTLVITASEVSNGDTSNDSTLSLTFTSSEATTNFATNDITVSNGTISGFSTTSTTVYTATFTPTGDGVCTIDVAANKFTDAQSNNNSAATQFNWTYDSTNPTATIALTDSTLTWGETTTVTIVFSETVTFNSDNDVTVQNGTLSTMTSADNITWTGTFTPTNDIIDSTNVISLTNTWTDSYGNSGSTVTSANYTINTTTSWGDVFSSTSPELLWDPASIVIRFGQCRFDLTGDLSGNRITDMSNNTTRFSEFNLDYQNYFSDISGATYDISMNEFKKYFYQGTKFKPYRRQKFENIAITDMSGDVVFIKDVSGNNSTDTSNTNYVTNIFDEILNHILASKSIPSMQHLSTDSLMYLISIFGTAKNLDDLCVLFNRKKGFNWEYDGMKIENLNRILAMRYDQVNNTTTAMDIYNNNDTYPSSIDKWNGITNLFSNPANQPGNNWKNKTVYFALSLLFWTKESNIDDIEFLLYFRTSATGTVTMSTAFSTNSITS